MHRSFHQLPARRLGVATNLLVLRQVQKVDLKKQYKQLYSAKANPQNISVPALNYLMVDGYGDPNTSEVFQKCVEALYTVAYTLKFAYKKGAEQIDYPVMALEGLWWAEDMSKFTLGDKSNWLWTLLIMQPEFVTQGKFEEAREAAFKKKANEYINKMRLEKWEEGKSAQILHIGPYSAEEENIRKLHEFIYAQGGKFNGLVQKHHEIYMSDMRRTAPEKLKTIIRQAFTV